MTEGRQDGAGRGFGTIDPRLTVFALANGMDLAKGDGYRRLEWFSEGLERGIMIVGDADGAYRVSVLSWKTGKAAETARRVPIRENVPADDVMHVLDGAIVDANGL